MAMAVVWTEMVMISLFFGMYTNRMDLVSEAAFSGAAGAVKLVLEMAGPLLLWSGVMEVLRETGLADGLARLFRPVLGRLFPEAARDPETLSAVSANVTANLLGLGNAATPLGIRAARRMAGCGDGAAEHGDGGSVEKSGGASNGRHGGASVDKSGGTYNRLLGGGSEKKNSGTASNELCRLVVLNTASVQLIPATAAALRASCGSAAPFDILPAVWLASGVSVCAGLLAARTLERFF